MEGNILAMSGLNGPDDFPFEEDRCCIRSYTLIGKPVPSNKGPRFVSGW